MQRFDCPAQPRGGPGDEVARREEDALEVQDVSEAGDDGVAAAGVALQVGIAQRQQAGLNHNQVGVFRGERREAPGRTDNDADADTAGQELLEDAPASASRGAKEKHGLLRGHYDGSW